MVHPPLPLPGPRPTRLVFGPVAIEWAPWIARPIEVEHTRLNGRAVYITGTAVTFRRGDFALDVPAHFLFDGASIPRWLWWLPGFQPLGKHLWAALLHDWCCELARRHPERMDRALADGLFESLLAHTHVGRWRGFLMGTAVAGYRRWNFLRGAR